MYLSSTQAGQRGRLAIDVGTDVGYVVWFKLTEGSKQ
jgi:hypothetical protein